MKNPQNATTNVGFFQNSALSADLCGSAVKICASLFRLKGRENRKGAKNAKPPCPAGIPPLLGWIAE